MGLEYSESPVTNHLLHLTAENSNRLTRFQPYKDTVFYGDAEVIQLSCKLKRDIHG